MSVCSLIVVVKGSADVHNTKKTLSRGLTALIAANEKLEVSVADGPLLVFRAFCDEKSAEKLEI